MVSAWEFKVHTTPNMWLRCVIMLFPFFPSFVCIIYLVLGNFTLLHLHVWIPYGRQHDLPTITRSGRAQDRRMCASYNLGDAAFAVRYALRNATAGSGDDEDDDMSRVPNGKPLCTCTRFYLVSRTSPSGARYCVARAYLEDTKVNYTNRRRGVCIPVWMYIYVALQI